MKSIYTFKNNFFFLLICFLSWSSFDIKFWNILYQISLFLSVSHIVILSSKILQPKEFIISYWWKSYMYLFVSYYWSFLSILSFSFLVSSDSFLISLFPSSFEKFPSVSFGFADFLLVSKFKKLKVIFVNLNRFFLFSKAFSRGEYVSLACSIIWVWSQGNISWLVRYSYLLVLPVVFHR